MSRILDLQQRAQNTLKAHQDSIEQKLDKGMTKIFDATENTLSRKAQCLKESIDSEKQSIQAHQSEATAQILKKHSIQVAKIEQQQAETAVQIMLEQKELTAQILKKQSEATAEISKEQSKALAELKASLSKYNDLSQETAHQIKLKKALFTSNIVLILVVLILLISSMSLGYIVKTKLDELSRVQAQMKIEKANLKETQESLKMSKQLFKQKYPELFTR